MKIIIKESKIDMLMADYVNSWIDAKRLIEFDRFIVLENPNGEENNEVEMEYDGDNGRLWFLKDFRKTLMDLFGKSYVETNEFVCKFFEHKFGVKVNKVD
jgi:hypothetical protein